MPLRSDLVAAAVGVERITAAIELPETVRFRRAQLIRDALTESGITTHIDELVARLVDESSASANDC